MRVEAADLLEGAGAERAVELPGRGAIQISVQLQFWLKKRLESLLHSNKIDLFSYETEFKLNIRQFLRLFKAEIVFR